MGTLISWTNETWNPTTGCHKVSAGCKHCYAEALSLRFGWSKKPWAAANAEENVKLHPERLQKPYTWKQPSRVFVNSMSDLFHPLVPDEYISEVFAVMNDLPQHTFQILTKRPERAQYWNGPWTDNIWMGTSVEDARVQDRIDDLRACPAQTRFLSCEPLIGALDLSRFWDQLEGIHWVIVGGESGRGYRPMDHAWARDIRDACVDSGIAFFFKQSSAPRTEMGTALLERDGSFQTWHQFPDDLTSPTPAEAHQFTPVVDLVKTAA